MALLQRLLYINASTTHPQSAAISAAIYEPVEGSISQIDPTSTGLPYDSVHAAVMDGWRVIQCPDPWSGMSANDGDDLIGFQFVLEKLEEY